MLEEGCLVMTADHSMSNVLEDDEGLTGFQVADAGEPWTEGDQMKVCPNLRAAHIYFRRSIPDLLQGVVQQLLPDPRIDQIMWRADRRPTVWEKKTGDFESLPGTGGLCCSGKALMVKKPPGITMAVPGAGRET
jgi:hypothetical protein